MQKSPVQMLRKLKVNRGLSPVDDVEACKAVISMIAEDTNREIQLIEKEIEKELQAEIKRKLKKS